ncbi:MAG: 50S ribosomal protein L4 [Firmicutes bacterium]|nr:50S ribosomal protein L4 [Bacillota bacterium]
MKIKVIDQKGKAAGEITVSPSVFGVERNDALIHEVAVAQMNNQRQGTKHVLSRPEVRGHAKKPYRQKGTGRARQGSTKSPHHTGGGVAFAPKPRDFSTKINKKKKEAAFKSAISGKLADQEIVVLKDVNLAEAKTKNVVAILEALKLDGKRVMFITAGKDDNFLRGANNIEKVEVQTAEQLCVMDIVNNKYLVASSDAIKAINEAYAAAEVK